MVEGIEEKNAVMLEHAKNALQELMNHPAISYGEAMMWWRWIGKLIMKGLHDMGHQPEAETYWILCLAMEEMKPSEFNEVEVLTPEFKDSYGKEPSDFQ